MEFTATLLFYLLIGGGIAVAVLVADAAMPAADRAFRTSTALIFWPLYLPILLTRPSDVATAANLRKTIEPVHDEMATAIAQVEGELDTALNSLDGWAEIALAGEHDRFAQLRSAWHHQAERIRRLDQLLAQPSFAGPDTTPRPDNPVSNPPSSATSSLEDQGPAGDRLRQTERNRRENVERLRKVRQQMHSDLMGTLAWVRELVTMIHLAKYTGAPASRAEELVSQIAAAVEGMSEVTAWQSG